MSRPLRRLADYVLALAAFAASLIVETWQWIHVPRRCPHHDGVAEQADGVVCVACGDFMRWWTGGRGDDDD